MRRDRELVRLAQAAGWRVTHTNGGHLRLSHPDASRCVIVAATPGDRRARANVLADLRRALNHPKRNGR